MIAQEFPSRSGRTELAGAPAGLDALWLGSRVATGIGLVHVVRDDARLAAALEAYGFFHPDLTVLAFPAWDCLPYDRVSPNAEVVSRRVATLARLAERREGERLVVVTTANAVIQKIPPAELFTGAVWQAKVGGKADVQALTAFLANNGYRRAETVREPGEFALRGGIVDLFAPGMADPVRLDLFSDQVEAIRRFDSVSQRSGGTLDSIMLRGVGEVRLDAAAVERFRTGYREAFGVTGEDDPLYAAVSAGKRHHGMEHWLPLFHPRLATLLDFLPRAAIALDHQIDEAIATRFEQIGELYETRRQLMRARESDAPPYRPLPPDRLYLTGEGWARAVSGRTILMLSPFAGPEGRDGALDAGGRPGAEFAKARVEPGTSLFDAVHAHLANERKAGRRTIIAAYSAGSRDRLRSLLRDHGEDEGMLVASWPDVLAAPREALSLAVLPLERGFVTADLAVVSEQDVLGDRLVRAAKRKRRSENFLVEASTLAEGDLVVHVEHGIGRFDGLATLDVAGAPHDCLRLIYDGGDKLFVPVENIDVLSRYGSEENAVTLDKLGGAQWQARKARVKNRITEIADELIKIAAARQTSHGERMEPASGLYDEFCARFPFPETDDQARAIEDTLGDLASGRSMDRLVCGDVGFGKTEVALRAAFIAAMSGSQVAVVVPTTLLCRQHFRTFGQRFKGLPLRIAQLSRLADARSVADTKRDLAEGRVDIVVGTTALLAPSIAFKRLGLLIVDEEQHFGVKQKERLKALKTDVHVLTLTATPIPRTLQLALAGVRDMSIIASPPVDRLAIRTFVLPFDPMVVREAIMRERFRGGQTFYVCPRIEDLAAVRERLAKLVPECRVETAHGRLSASEIEKVMTAFYDGRIDILLSTNIIESGLDIPTVNTIVVHRADMFGLAQLYQLRGRVGRGKLRAYAYLTTPDDRNLTPTAQRRLEVMQTLDTLGAGFQLASHDLDIRGAGNLLGEEQSGHIREVGIELYQHLLEEAVLAARETGGRAVPVEDWSPQINLGMPVMIPESYVADLNIRLGLYRRLGTLGEAADIDGFAAELIDRFGKLPAEVENLLAIVRIKQLCRTAGVDRVEAGPKGVVVGFRENRFARPERLVAMITRQAATVKLRPDHKLVYMRPMDEPRARLNGVNRVLSELASLAA